MCSAFGNQVIHSSFGRYKPSTCDTQRSRYAGEVSVVSETNRSKVGKYPCKNHGTRPCEKQRAIFKEYLRGHDDGYISPTICIRPHAISKYDWQARCRSSWSFNPGRGTRTSSFAVWRKGRFLVRCKTRRWHHSTKLRGITRDVCGWRNVRQQHPVLHQNFVRQPSYRLAARILDILRAPSKDESRRGVGFRIVTFSFYHECRLRV